MKYGFFLLFMLFAINVQAESLCDIRPGTSSGVRVVEFVTGHLIHSKMPLREGHADALLEEMRSLQDLSICSEKIVAQKCVLKFEKVKKVNFITLYRGKDKWSSWDLKSKETAQKYVKNLKRVGFCS